MARRYHENQYRVIRMYLDDGIPARTIKRGLTQAEAQAHCRDPETSSSTCTNAAGRRRTRLRGPWFDGWDHDYIGR